MDRDLADHVRFCPLQSKLGQELCAEHGAPIDISTAVLIEDGVVYTESDAILRLFPWMGLPFSALGPVGLVVPHCIRDTCYRAFARNRGSIWRNVKKVMGWGDTILEDHRDKVIGLEEPVPRDWGFSGSD